LGKLQRDLLSFVEQKKTSFQSTFLEQVGGLICCCHVKQTVGVDTSAAIQSSQKFVARKQLIITNFYQLVSSCFLLL
jgi:hypothetical protein